MEKKSNLERARAWADGSMVGAELSAFEAELRSDSELREFAESYRAVFHATRGLGASEEPSGLEFETLERQLDADERPSWSLPKRAAAAAAIVVFASAAWWWAASSIRQDSLRHDRVALAAIPLDSSEPLRKATPLPEWFAEYTPVSNGEIQWIESLDDGVRLSKLSGAPLLLWGVHPTCPYCKKMRENTLTDGTVLAAMEQWVPVKLDVMKTQYFSGISPMENGFPFWELRNAEFVELTKAYGYMDSTPFGDMLQSHVPAGATRVIEAQATFAMLIAAREHEAQSRMSQAQRAYRELAELAAGTALEAEADSGLARIEQRAARDLAQALRSSDPSLSLSNALRDFEGTSYASDFERVLEAYRHRGRLPELTREERVE